MTIRRISKCCDIILCNRKICLLPQSHGRFFLKDDTQNETDTVDIINRIVRLYGRSDREQSKFPKLIFHCSLSLFILRNRIRCIFSVFQNMGSIQSDGTHGIDQMPSFLCRSMWSLQQLAFPKQKTISLSFRGSFGMKLIPNQAETKSSDEQCGLKASI